MITVKALLIILFLLVGQVLAAETETDNDDTVRSRQITITGNDSIRGARIRSLMETDTKGLFGRILFWRKPPPFFRGQLNTDLVRVERFYQRQGFLHVDVSADVDIKDNQAFIKIVVEENVRVKISSIEYLLEGLSEQEKSQHQQILKNISDKARLQEGGAFIDEDFRADLRMIQDYYDKKGHPFVKTAYSLELEEDEESVAVTIQITPGKRAYIGQISFEGLKRTEKRLLDRLLTFEEGDEYDRTTLERSRNNLQAAEIFRLVSVGLILEQQQDYVPVEIYVREKDNITMGFGVGYGMEDKVRLYTEISKMRFLGGLRTGRIVLKHSSLEPIHVDLKVKQPVFPTIHSSIVMNPFYRQEEERAYSIERLGLNTTLNHRLSGNSAAFFTYSFEDNELKSGSDEDKPTSYPATFAAKKLLSPPELPSTDEEESYRKSTVSIGFLRDSSRPDFYPDRGSLFSAVFSYSGLGFDADFDYLKLISDVRFYRNIGSSLVMAARVKGGFIEPLYDSDFIPYEERFYAGGTFSVRGWSRAGLGPMNRDGEPIGGKSYLEGSLELRYPVWRDLSLVNFLDAGNVWEDRFAHSIRDIRFASGLGIRYATPIGPVRADIGTPVFDDDKSIQFFLSIGQSF